jgi:hypothetical protein
MVKEHGRFKRAFSQAQVRRSGFSPLKSSGSEGPVGPGSDRAGARTPTMCGRSARPRPIPDDLRVGPPEIVSTAPPARSRLTGLDCLEGTAVACVILIHAVPSGAPGYERYVISGIARLGVTLFIVICGFLIGRTRPEGCSDCRRHPL